MGVGLATGYLEFSLRHQPGAPLGRLPPGQGPLPPPACKPQGSSPPICRALVPEGLRQARRPAQCSVAPL